MSVKNVIGVIILCLVVGVPFGFAIHEIGWRDFLLFVGTITVIIAAILGAVWCLTT